MDRLEYSGKVYNRIQNIEDEILISINHFYTIIKHYNTVIKSIVLNIVERLAINKKGITDKIEVRKDIRKILVPKFQKIN